MQSKTFTSRQLSMILLSCCSLLGVGCFMYAVDLSFLQDKISAISKRDNGFEFGIYSNNVRVDTNSRFPSEQPWSERKGGVVQALQSRNENSPTLVGLQELKHNQLVDVLEGLNGNNNSSPWTHFGVGRDDGVEKGEYAAILYNTNEWNLLNGTYKWLSETPDTPSIAWGAATIRIVTMTTMQHKKSGKVVNFFNTHFDQKSEEARQKSADLISGWIQEIPNDYPTFLSGDFNSISSDVAYQTLQKSMKDSNTVAYEHINGDYPTYTGFEKNDNQSIIDFIWSPLDTNQENSNTYALEYEVLDNMYNGSRFSDHRPVNVHFKVYE
ncbi:uncharacterized protein AC631_00016 [Debaryomyces fabryi]|uniref:Endonuclease/exonuclease/phosphatase domain-containing protein n=1 Tax=Debaryomyces fabryi TaxID=58627 RepID=A0A0V1Q6J3_9ASCO|nr:uncharacterized protein AC631_00016 [Debaryomyces fabryi]KSA04145.1 hypothetical protein AC631_00016 [Debaryomyces fabryi]CUM46201.1 unnamed protein product [Debaryomyces fabryi]